MYRLLLTCTFALIAAFLQAQTSPLQLLNQAEQAYLHSDYAQAASLYQDYLTENPASAEIFYNLGCAHFKNKDVPRARLAFERAARLNPADEDINFNLKLSLSYLIDKVEVQPELFIVSWFREIRNLASPETWNLLSIIIFALALAGWLTFFFVDRLLVRKIAFAIAVAGLVVAATSYYFGIWHNSERNREDFAIILAEKTNLKSAPDDSGTSLLVLHGGLKVEVTDHLGGWTEIRLPDSTKGWLKDQDLEKI